ncbi:MAG: tRNA lysidine(34) synthetase TilS, partial [Pseudomonadota bacterium]|nr:tRNA lysidine(34) synthetase TilS [Pseudomonadota bacterium]
PEGPNRSLKNLLQESAILPWMRGHIPLVYSGDFLLAVGDLWLNADCQAASDESGISIKWRTNSAFK